MLRHRLDAFGSEYSTSRGDGGTQKAWSLIHFLRRQAGRFFLFLLLGQQAWINEKPMENKYGKERWGYIGLFYFFQMIFVQNVYVV